MKKLIAMLLSVLLLASLGAAAFADGGTETDEETDEVLRFETQDIDGNALSSEDIFAEHAVTMVNVWATWCPPCVGELEDLGAMHRRLAEKDAAVVGVCLDADEALDACKELLEENNVDYLNLVPYDNMLRELEIRAIPMSFFVGRDGTILASPVVGAPQDMSSYEEVIDGILEDPAAAVHTEAKNVRENDAGVYRVIVTAPAGDPVEGAWVQFCTDTACVTAKTDAEGVAVFEVEEASYTVHILKVPKGYELPGEDYRPLETYSDVYVTLEDAA